VCYAGEGHGIRREPNVLDMYRRVEAFLCRHLELPPPPPFDDSWTAGNTAELGGSASAEEQMPAKRKAE
jgi:hypothetical protein